MKQQHRPYVDIDALNNNEDQAIEYAATVWPDLNPRQKDKIRHSIPKPIYDTIVTMSKDILDTINKISDTTHKSSESSSDRASSAHQHYFDSEKSNSEKREFSEKADRQHEREQNRIKEQHAAEQETTKTLIKWAVGGAVALGSIAAYAMKKD